MTTLREAAQQALEALEEAHPKPYNEDVRAHYEAITALRTALQTPPPPPEAQTDGEKNAYHYGWWAAMEAVRKQRTEPVQEPLFLLHTGAVDSDGEQDEWETEADSGRRVDAFCRKHPGQTIGLYPHLAPQRTEPVQEFVCSTGLCRYRKPLTDEEILSDEVLRYHFGCNGGAGPVSQKGIKIVRAVERAHGIGGEA